MSVGEGGDAVAALQEQGGVERTYTLTEHVERHALLVKFQADAMKHRLVEPFELAVLFGLDEREQYRNTF